MQLKTAHKTHIAYVKLLHELHNQVLHTTIFISCSVPTSPGNFGTNFHLCKKKLHFTSLGPPGPLSVLMIWHKSGIQGEVFPLLQVFIFLLLLHTVTHCIHTLQCTAGYIRLYNVHPHHLRDFLRLKG